MRLLLLCLVVVFVSAPADAQRRGERSFAKKGDFALVAEVRGLEVRGFSPALGGVGLRYRLADQTVLGVGAGGQLTEDTRTRRFGDLVEEIGSERSSVGGVVWIEQHIGRSRRTVSPFLGGGVGVSYRRFSDRSPLQVQTCTVEGGETVCEINSYIRESSQEGVTLSGGLVLGAEVRVVKGITLGGAYSLGMGYTWYEDQQSSTFPQNPQEQTRTNDAISIGTGSPTLNLSVYF